MFGRFWNQTWGGVGKVGQNYFKPSARLRFFSRIQFSQKKLAVRPINKYSKIYRYGYQKMRLKPLNTVHILVFNIY